MRVVSMTCCEKGVMDVRFEWITPLPGYDMNRSFESVLFSFAVCLVVCFYASSVPCTHVLQERGVEKGKVISPHRDDKRSSDRQMRPDSCLAVSLKEPTEM